MVGIKWIYRERGFLSNGSERAYNQKPLEQLFPAGLTKRLLVLCQSSDHHPLIVIEWGNINSLFWDLVVLASQLWYVALVFLLCDSIFATARVIFPTIMHLRPPLFVMHAWHHVLCLTWSSLLTLLFLFLRTTDCSVCSINICRKIWSNDRRLV
jgi:hypothetical protein